MKKILFLLTAVLFLTSCSNKSAKPSQGNVFSIAEFENFIKEASKNAAEFSTEHWAKLEKEYDELLNKVNTAADNLSDEDRQTLERLKESFEAKKVESLKSIKELKDKNLELVDKVKDNIIESVNDRVDKVDQSVSEQLDQSKEQADQLIKNARNSLDGNN